MKLQTVLIIAALCVGAGLVSGLALASPVPCDVTTADAAPVGRDAPDPELMGATTELERAQHNLAEERTRREAAESELAALRSGADGPTSQQEAEEETGSGDPRAPRFVYEGFEVALSKPDWAEAGEAVNKVQPLIAELRYSLAHGQEPSASAAMIQRWNSTILGMAMMAKQAGVPGTGVNGTYSHPVVMVNLIYATLEAAGQPLDETQAERLGALGDKFLREDQARLSGYAEASLRTEKLIAEAALRDRFFAEADQLLSKVQRNVLHPESVRGRLGIDLFSSGILWSPLVRPLEFTTRADLETAWIGRLQRAYGFEPEFAPTLADSVADWARGFSDEYLAASDDPHARGGGKLSNKLTGWFRVEHVRVAAEHQLVLTRVLIERLPVGSPLIERLRSGHRIAVPIKRPAK